jgi:hypothetical protein
MKKTPLRKDQFYSWDVFQILMEYEIIRTVRYPTPISLIHLEMKPHASGEKTHPSVPFIFETVINSQLRSVDIPTRYETGYLILLPSTNETGAQTLCERLLTTFNKKFETQDGKSVKFSLQIGITSHNGGPTLMKETLLEAAESGLQQSRLKGVNTICTITNIHTE